MKLMVLISLALIATINANVFDSNGMSKIGDIIQDNEDIKLASEDLDIMESRLAGLDAQMGAISSVKNSMTQAMDKTALKFTGEHTNEENGELCVNIYTQYFPCNINFIYIDMINKVFSKFSKLK